MDTNTILKYLIDMLKGRKKKKGNKEKLREPEESLDLLLV
jgi:hypothetical protein